MILRNKELSIFICHKFRLVFELSENEIVRKIEHKQIIKI